MGMEGPGYGSVRCVGGAIEERTGRTGDMVRGDWSFCLALCTQGKGLLVGWGKSCCESRRRQGGAGWEGLLGQWAWASRSPSKKARMEGKEDLEPESPVRRGGWRWQKGAHAGRNDTVRRTGHTGGGYRTKPRMEGTGQEKP